MGMNTNGRLTLLTPIGRPHSDYSGGINFAQCMGVHAKEKIVQDEARGFVAKSKRSAEEENAPHGSNRPNTIYRRKKL